MLCPTHGPRGDVYSPCTRCWPSANNLASGLAAAIQHHAAQTATIHKGGDIVQSRNNCPLFFTGALFPAVQQLCVQREKSNHSIHWRRLLKFSSIFTRIKKATPASSAETIDLGINKKWRSIKLALGSQVTRRTATGKVYLRKPIDHASRA